jgi:site-specific DNA-methyltransferase (adenine-specific)
MFSSATDNWETPQALFDELNREFDFEVDLCATPENTKCPSFITPEINSLSAPWGPFFNRRNVLWCNPPYGREIGSWIRKAAETVQEKHSQTGGSCTIVMLLPARTDTRWFHDYIYGKEGVEVRFLKGRLKFGRSENSAPFPSMIVIFRHPSL